MNEIDFTQLVVVLAWLAGPAGMTAWMVFLSNAIRNLREGDQAQMDEYSKGIAGWIRSLTPLALQTLVTGLAFGVPIVAGLILNAIPAEALAAVQSTYSFIATLFIIYLGQQVWFQVTKPKPQPVASVSTEVSASGAQKTTAQVGGVVAESSQVAGLAPASSSAVPK